MDTTKEVEKIPRMAEGGVVRLKLATGVTTTNRSYMLQEARPSNLLKKTSQESAHMLPTHLQTGPSHAIQGVYGSMYQPESQDWGRLATDQPYPDNPKITMYPYYEPAPMTPVNQKVYYSSAVQQDPRISVE